MAAFPGNYSTGVFTNDIKIDELLKAGDVLAQYVIEEQWAITLFNPAFWQPIAGPITRPA